MTQVLFKEKSMYSLAVGFYYLGSGSYQESSGQVVAAHKCQETKMLNLRM
jgi:hypothetical protein